MLLVSRPYSKETHRHGGPVREADPPVTRQTEKRRRSAPDMLTVALGRRFLAVLRNAHIQRRDDWEMAVNRFIAGIMVLLISALTPEQSSREYDINFLAVGLYIAVGLMIATHIVVASGPPRRRRLVALVVDLGAISYEMHHGGSGAAWLYPGYLWVIFGNGFRFGSTFLLLAMGVGALSFGAVIIGSPFWRTQPLLSSGLFVGLVIVPLYAFVLIRKLSQARQQAEEANRAKSLFLASVSHDLRTPLNAIIGMGALLASGRLNAEQRDMNKTIMVAARTLLSSIDGILDLSRESRPGRCRTCEPILTWQSFWLSCDGWC